MKPTDAINLYPFTIPVPDLYWKKLRLIELPQVSGARPQIMQIRRLVDRLNRLPERQDRPVSAGLLHLYGLLYNIFRHIITQYETAQPQLWEQTLTRAGYQWSGTVVHGVTRDFIAFYPSFEMVAGRETAEGFVAGDDAAGNRKKLMLAEMLLVRLAERNPALDPFRELISDRTLMERPRYKAFHEATGRELLRGPRLAPFNMNLLDLLLAPIKASPHSLQGQMEYIREKWSAFLPADLLEEILVALDIVKEEERVWWGGAGKPQVLEFGLPGRAGGAAGYEYPEYERFSSDTDWMSNVVMIAKMVYVWLDQLSRKYGRLIQRLDQIPDEELDTLAAWGFTALWLIGLWERSPASQKIKQIGGNPEAISSAYSLYDYVIAADLGGDEALGNLKWRAAERGIRLASDMVPNHTGIYSKWTVEHPDWFIQLDYPPYPAYSYTGPDLSFDQRVSLRIEDGYWDKRDAAVVFQHVDNHSGRVRHIYHGNDGTSTPWNDTAQLNYLLPDVREAVIQTILHVARQFPIIRFDAAMTLAKKHYQRLWYPQPGLGSGVPSRAEHGMSREEFDAAFPAEFWRDVVDRVAAEAPDTLLLAEAFWLMEGYFVRTLGMHRVYNSAFMNMLKMEENAKYRQTIKNVLEFNPEILKRFVNFMNNPDERTAIEQFGKEGKYVGAAVLLVTMPGLPMIGHGQIEGFHEKYGMEYKRSYWNEPVDEHLVDVHRQSIFPLMRKRHLFSGSEDFILYDFFAGSNVDENVFAYSNRTDGERGVILFNNCYGSTAGWIRTSTARMVKTDSGEALRRTTLGETLGFNPDGRYYYAFRDYAGGDEYIRSGRDLCEKGMYVDLGPYEYHAFLDFREIYDDEYGTWGRMCHVLEGRPVPSIDEEVKRIRYAPVIEAFADALTHCSAILPRSVMGKQQKTDACAALTRFYTVLAEATMCTGNVEDLAAESLKEMASIAGGAILGAGRTRTTGKGTKGGTADTAAYLLLAAFLVMHRTGRLARSKDYPQTASCWFEELGLARRLAEEYDRRHVAETELPIDGSGAALLLEIILASQEMFFGWGKEVVAKNMRHLFTDHAVRRLLLIHWSGGKEWFNKERFELLVQWVAIAEAIVSPAAAGPAVRRKAYAPAATREEAVRLVDLAREAGYQAATFLEMLGPALPAAAAEEEEGPPSGSGE